LKSKLRFVPFSAINRAQSLETRKNGKAKQQLLTENGSIYLPSNISKNAT